MAVQSKMANINISQIRMKRGNTAASGSYIGPLGELLVDTGLQTIRIQDGVTAGGMSTLATQDYVGTIVANAAVGNVDLSSYATQANLTAFSTYANITFGTSSYGNSNVAAYLVANPQGSTYSNVNVQAYLGANVGAFHTYANVTFSTIANAGAQQTQINSINANVTAANSAIVTANTGMKSYVDAVTTAWTANAAAQAQANNIAASRSRYGV